jgi:hypothetical protein
MLAEIQNEYIFKIFEKNASKKSPPKIRKIDFKTVFDNFANTILKSIILIFGEEFLDAFGRVGKTDKNRSVSVFSITVNSLYSDTSRRGGGRYMGD